MRQIKDPVVAAAPAGVRIRTRIRCTAEEAQALTEMGTFLGSTYRGELVERIQLGRLDRTAHAVWRAERKRALTGVSSSRWAGSITRAVEDQYQLGMRGVVAHAADLRTAIDVLAQRCALRPGESAPIVGDAEARSSRSRQRRGYRTPAERFARTRRLATLRGRLVAAENGCATGRPSIAVGGKRLWHNRNNLDATDMSKEQWQERWDAARFFLTADGESGKPGGNETFVSTKRVDYTSRHPRGWHPGLARTYSSRRRYGIAIVAMNGLTVSRAAERCVTTSATTRQRTAGTSTRPGGPHPLPCPGSMNSATDRWWAWTSMRATWRPACSTFQVTQSAKR